MKILIAGDSWANANYYGPPGPPPETHLHYLLEADGHEVVCLAVNGGSNFGTIDRVKYWFENLHQTPNPWPYQPPAFDNHEFDYIIWFHTSPYRDCVDQTYYNAKANVFDSDAYYPILNQKIREELTSRAKVIAIGGCVKLSPRIDKSLFHYYIEDWKSDIVGVDLPEGMWWGICGWENPTVQDVEEAEEISKYVYHNDDFPDGGHPGIRPHAELLQRLKSEVFEKNDK